MADEPTIAPPPETGEPQQTPAPSPDPGGQPPAARKLYDQLNKSQLYMKSFEDFQQQFSKPEAIDKLYQNLNGAKLYTKSKDDFYGQFFGDQKPAPEHEISHTPVQDIRHLNDLANQPVRSTVTSMGTGAPGVAIDNPEDVARNKGYQDRYDKSVTDLAGQWGTDPKLTKQTLQDFPGEPDENKLKTFAGMAQNNPVYYNRLKSANDIRMTIAASGPDGVNDANVFNHLQTSDNYEQLQHNIALQQEIMHKHGLGQQFFEKLKESQAPLINTLDPGLNIQYWNSDDKKLGLSDFQYAGLETEKMFNPGKYQQDVAIIKHNRGLDEGSEPVAIPTGKQGYAYDRGVENVLFALEHQGRDNTGKFIDQRSAELGPSIGDLKKQYQDQINATSDPSQQKQMLQEFQQHPLLQEAAKLDEGQQSIDYARTEDQRRFPLNYGDQASRLVKDAMGSTNGWAGVAGKQVLLGAGESADNTMRFIKNTYINLLGSEQAKAANAASNIGHQALTQLAGYEGDAFSSQQSPLLVDDGLVKKIQSTFNDPALSTEQKNQQATSLILNNEGAIKANPKAGQQNLSGKAVIYTAANTIGQILGIADQSLLMGGLMGDASKAQQMASAVVPMYASTQNQLYEQALARGDEKPLLSSHIDAAIISLASLINPDIKVVKGMVGAETGIGKLIAGVEESTWDKVLSTNKPLMDRMIAGTKATARQLGLANLQYGLIVPTAQYVVHKNILNEDPNLGDALKDGLLQTNISMALPALLHGVWGGVNSARVNPMQKFAIVEAGLHPKENVELIDQLVEKGQITPDRADQIKDVIKQTGDILEKTEAVKSDGTWMNEHEVSDLTYQMLRKKVLEGKLKNAPDPQKPAIEAKIHEVNQSIADLHTSDEHKQKSELNQLLTDNLDRIRDKIQPMESSVKEAIKRNEPESVFKEIYDQASQTTNVEGKEVSARAATEDIYGKALVDKAFDLHKEKPEKSAVPPTDEQVAEKPKEGAVPESGKPAEPAASSFLQSRHADTIHDEQGIVSGPNNKELSPKGKRDANDLAKDVEGKGVTNIITSGLERSKETGDTVAGKVGAKVENRPALNTWDIKDFDGLKDDEFKDVQQWFVENPDNTVYQGPLEKYRGKEVAESVNEYANRIIPEMEKIEKETGPETLVINHSNNMMLWDAYLKNGREWNEQAREDYLHAEKPEPATLAGQSAKGQPAENEPVAEAGSAGGKIPYKEFRDRVLNEYLNVQSSALDFNYSGELSYKDRVKAVADIKAGKDSAPARKLEKELQAMHDSGNVAINRGRGAHATSTEIPISEWFGLTNEEKQAADKMDDRTASLIIDEGISSGNIDNLKHLFNGFPYDETDFESVKKFLSAKDQSDVPPQTDGAGSEATGSSAGTPDAPGDSGSSPIDPESWPFREEPFDTPVGIKKVISESVRAQWKLPEVEFPKLGSDDEVLQRGKEAVDSGKINPREVARRVVENNGIYTPEEGGAMQYYAHQLRRAESTLREEKHEADDILQKEPDNTAAFYAKLTVEQRLGQLDDEIELKTRADRTNSNSWGKLGNVMQIETDESFSPSRVRATIQDNYGGEMPEAVQAKLDQAFAERDQAISDLKKAKDKIALQAIEKDAAKDQPKEPRTVAEKKEALKKERIDLIEALKKALKKDAGNLGANPLPIHTIEAISKLALNYFKDGVVTLEGLTNKVYDDLKDVVGGLDKKAVREAISGYQPLRENTRTKETARVSKKADATEEKMASGKIEPDKRTPILNFEKDTNYIKAKQRLVNAEFKIKQEKMKSYASKESRLQKTLGWANRLMRLSILSGVKVLEKLAAAATIGSAAQKPLEEVLNGLWGQVFPKIKGKADADMGLNTLAVARYYSHFFNPVEFARDTKDIVTTGETRLGKELEKQHSDHIALLDLPTDLHQVIKGPAKRATFEYALTKILAAEQQKGVDINHPLVLESARQRAFARAKYEIFMEDNSVSRTFGKWEAKWKDQGKAGAAKSFLLHFAFPVSKVPTNIARRVGLSVAGLPMGLIKASEAYRKGIDNLSTEEANAIGRSLTKGSIGIALWTAGFLGYKSLGGLYSKFDPNKQRKNEPLADEMKLLGQPISKPWQHAIPFEVMQLGATFRHIYEKTKTTSKSDPIAIAEATMGGTGAILEQIPVVETPINVVTATQDPYQAKRLGKDLKRRVEPQLLHDLGIIKDDDKKPAGRSGRTGGHSR